MQEEFTRAARLLGEAGVERLRTKTVAVFGIGGVGSFAAEALARGGIGKLVLIDNDTVSVSNLNRQLIALHSTVGMMKTAVMSARIHDICPETAVETHDMFYLPENADTLSMEGWDYIVDAIDTVSGKIELAVRAAAAGIPLISCMGTGNKRDPEQLTVTDLAKTHTCPLARVMRTELRRRGILHLPVVYSTEPPQKPLDIAERGSGTRRQIPGSLSFVPPVAGMLAAGKVIRDLVGDDAQ